MKSFIELTKEIAALLVKWEPILLEIPELKLTDLKNSQNRTIKQIVGHMVDSASNNIHRVVHLQYQKSPLIFPDYANHGNNDRWIAIQNYQSENWFNLIQVWKYIHLHFLHVINNINLDKLQQVWISGLNEEISLENMVTDFLRHFKLHLSEIDELMKLGDIQSNM